MGKHPAGTGAQDAIFNDIRGVCRVRAEQRRLAGTLLACVLVLGNAHANAQTGANPPTVRNEIANHPRPMMFAAHWSRQRPRTRFLSSFSHE